MDGGLRAYHTTKDALIPEIFNPTDAKRRK